MSLITVNYDPLSTIVQGSTTLKDAITEKYPEVFREEPGRFPETVLLSVDGTVAPAVSATCELPMSIKPHVQQTLQELEQQQIITRVDEATKWVNHMVVAKKKC
ncbi:hypothetical protein MRX96_057322 [Rhipicephalus microplus]